MNFTICDFWEYITLFKAYPLLHFLDLSPRTRNSCYLHMYVHDVRPTSPIFKSINLSWQFLLLFRSTFACTLLLLRCKASGRCSPLFARRRSMPVPDCAYRIRSASKSCVGTLFTAVLIKFIIHAIY